MTDDVGIYTRRTITRFCFRYFSLEVTDKKMLFIINLDTSVSRLLIKKLLFIMNQESERYRQDLYMSVGPMKD